MGRWRRRHRGDGRQELGQRRSSWSARRRASPGVLLLVRVVVGGGEHGVRQALSAPHGRRAVGQAPQGASDEADRLVPHGADPGAQGRRQRRRHNGAAVRRAHRGPAERQRPAPGRHSVFAVHAEECARRSSTDLPRTRCLCPTGSCCKERPGEI